MLCTKKSAGTLRPPSGKLSLKVLGLRRGSLLRLCGSGLSGISSMLSSTEKTAQPSVVISSSVVS